MRAIKSDYCDEDNEVDEFCSLRSGSSDGEFLTPRMEPADQTLTPTMASIPLLSQLPPPVVINDYAERRRSFCASCLKYIVDPRRIFHRCILHLLICLYIPGAYFADSILAAYKTQILEYLRIDHEHFALLFSLPSLTGVLCGPFGVIVAKYGSTKSALSAAMLTCVGSALVVVGLQNKAYGVVLLGRIIFWTFLYILCVVQTVLCYRLFSGNSLVAAYGLIIVACRSGGVAGSALNASLLEWYHGDVVKAVSFASTLTAVGLLCAIVFAVLYKGTRTARLVWPLLAHREVDRGEDSTQAQQWSWKSLPALYWVLWLALGLLYASIFPFETVAVDYYVGDWKMTQKRAGMILSTCPLWSLFSPLLSTLLTSIIRKTSCLLIAFTLITVGLLGQALHLMASPLWFVIMTGVGYALGGTCTWVLASDILSASGCRSPSMEATAVAMLYVSLGALMFMSSYVAGVVRDHSHDYRPCILFFTCLSSIALACAGVLHYSALKGSLSVIEWDDGYDDDEVAVDGDDEALSGTRRSSAVVVWHSSRQQMDT